MQNKLFHINTHYYDSRVHIIQTKKSHWHCILFFIHLFLRIFYQMYSERLRTSIKHVREARKNNNKNDNEKLFFSYSLIQKKLKNTIRCWHFRFCKHSCVLFFVFIFIFLFDQIWFHWNHSSHFGNINKHESQKYCTKNNWNSTFLQI